jgi:15-cis-phytoene synthase
VSHVTLDESYALCRDLNRRHGTTYYASTYLLPAVKRPYVHALYGFCRFADEIVDDLGPVPVDERAKALDALAGRLLGDLAVGHSDHPVLRAVVHTAHAFHLPATAFERFLQSMSMDLRIDRYETFDDLLTYMDGSAAVIGELVLPILEPTSAAAFESARALGVAFQLTNFIRDVDEDLDRGRVYLPQDDVRRFGADPWRRTADEPWQAFLADQVARARSWYAVADEGIGLLPARSARCVGAARRLYAGILDRVEDAGYDVFSRRCRVPAWRKLAVAARGVAAR